MFNLGLSENEFDALKNSFADSEQIKTKVFLLTLEHEFVSDISHLGPNGSTSINADADIQSSASFDFFDPSGISGLDIVSDIAGSRPPDRLIQVYRSSFVKALSRWIDVPVFCGVIVSTSRDGDRVTAEAQSKDILALDKPWKSFTIPKGTLITDAVKLILEKMTGETRFKIGANDAKLSANYSVGSDTEPLTAVRSLLSGINFVSFYDAEGWFVADKPSTSVSMILRDGDGGIITSRVERNYRTDDIVNAVRVVPKNRKNIGEAVADPSHPYSPEKLGRNNVPRYIWNETQSESSLSKAQAKQNAELALANALIDSVEISFEGMPVPVIDPLDLIRVDADRVFCDVRFKQMNVPWNSGLASYGFLPRVKKAGT